MLCKGLPSPIKFFTRFQTENNVKHTIIFMDWFLMKWYRINKTPIGNNSKNMSIRFPLHKLHEIFCRKIALIDVLIDMRVINIIEVHFKWIYNFPKLITFNDKISNFGNGGNEIISLIFRAIYYIIVAIYWYIGILRDVPEQYLYCIGPARIGNVAISYIFQLAVLRINNAKTSESPLCNESETN